MSLCVWLPLTKDLRNQGLDNITVTNNGATFNSAGKLGGCYSFPTTGGNLSIPSNAMSSVISSNGCSLAFWIKLNAWNTGYETYFQAGTGSIPWNNYIFGILRNNTASTVCFTIGNGSTVSNASYLTSAWETGVWFHMVFTYETGKCKIYKNGVLDKEYTTSIVPDFSKITKITIGRCNNNSSYQTNCNMNDIRIYNHCLSPMEVKLISQGLVLHYPLNRNGWGQENLLLNSNIEKSGKNTIITYDLSTEGITAVKGATMQISADIKSDVANATIDCYVRSSTSNSMCSNTIFTGIGTTYQRYTMTTVCNTNQDKTPQWFAFRSNGFNGTTTTATFTIKNVKLEIGEIVTPWCPNSSDTLATTMGLNSTTEYDCSGFCNNGTRTGTFTWTSDTPKYAVSQNCLGTNYIYLTPPSTEIQTMAVWVKWNTIPSGQSVILVDNGSGIGLGLYSGGILCSTSGAGSSYAFRKANLVANTWYHFVVVKTGTTTRKLYINGVEQTANSSSSNWSYSVNQLQLGKRSTTSDGFVGKLSDFRIYATALSADDVQSLYQNSAYIDNNGNVYGAVHSEV